MESWELIADTDKRMQNKCNNSGCRVYCDPTNKITCEKCKKFYCMRCRLFESHNCKVYYDEIKTRDNKENTKNNIFYEDYKKLE